MPKTTSPEKTAAQAPGDATGGAATAPQPDPAAGGSYSRDPATGALTLVEPATQPAPAARKVQDPVTGAITRVTIAQE